MSSIYVDAAKFLQRGGYYERQRHSMPLIVCNRGMFDCLAPRIAGSEVALPNCTAFILSKACTFHLTREVSVQIDSRADFDPATTLLRKLTQVASLTLHYDARRDHNDVSFRPIFAEIKRFALTLTRLFVSSPRLPDVDIAELARSVAELRNLEELSIPALSPAMCTAIAAGPGARLHELSVGTLNCQAADMDALVAGCPNIWALRLSRSCRFEFVLAASKLPYLQVLEAWVDNSSPVETDMRTCLDNMGRLTKLELTCGNYYDAEFSSVTATAIATAVGPQLIELTLSTQISSDAFATICCASSFPRIEVLSLLSSGRISDDVTVSLSPSLRRLSLSHSHLARRTLAQLLSDKLNLKDVKLSNITFTRRRGRSSNNNNDDDEVAPTQTEQVEDDWFGQLVKSPLQKLSVSGTATAASMDTRIALLAPTLVAVRLEIDDDGWPAVPRDEFLGTMFSNCVLLERVFVLAPYGDNAITAIDSKVAFAGLRNNERLGELTLFCNISSSTLLVDELLEMRSTDLHSLYLRNSVLNLEQCTALAERFVHLDDVSKVQSTVFPMLRQRFPHVTWR